MGTSPRTHTVPLPGETPTRALLSAGLASVDDIVPVANATERAQLVADLAAVTPANPVAYVPSAARPLYVHRGDRPAGDHVEFTTDGTNWRSLQATPIQSRSRSTPLDYTPTNSAIDFPNAETTPTPALFSYSAGVFTCLIPGTYHVEVRVNFAQAGAVVGYETALIVNGMVYERAIGVTSTVGGTSSQIGRTIALVAGATLWVRAFAQGAIGAFYGGDQLRIQMTRVGS